MSSDPVECVPLSVKIAECVRTAMEIGVKLLIGADIEGAADWKKDETKSRKFVENAKLIVEGRAGQIEREEFRQEIKVCQVARMLTSAAIAGLWAVNEARFATPLERELEKVEEELKAEKLKLLKKLKAAAPSRIPPRSAPTARPSTLTTRQDPSTSGRRPSPPARQPLTSGTAKHETARIHKSDV